MGRQGRWLASLLFSFATRWGPLWHNRVVGGRAAILEITMLGAKSGDACATVLDRQSPARPAIDAGNTSKNQGRSQVSLGELRRVYPLCRSKPCLRSRHQSAW